MPNKSPSWSDTECLESLDDDQQKLIDIEQNIANLEKSMTLQKKESVKKYQSKDKTNLNTDNQNPSERLEKSPGYDKKR